MTAVRLAPASDPGSDARRRRRALWVLAAAAALVVAAVAVDAAAGTVTPPRPAPVRREAARAGTWYCPAVARAGERAVLTRRRRRRRAVARGRRPLRALGVARGDVTTVEPGAAATVALEGDDARHPVAVRWSGGPVAATWRVDGDRTAAAPCEPTPAATWHIPGFDTTLGSRSRLHLFNPFPTDAVVRLVFATPAGPVRLVLSDNLVAAGGRTTTFNLARFQPEIPDLGVTVEVLTGRVVAQGELLADPPGDIPGTTGRALLPGAPEPSLTWYAPYAQQGDGTSRGWRCSTPPTARPPSRSG